MQPSDVALVVGRRSFFSRLGAGLAAFRAAGSDSAAAFSPATEDGAWQAVRHTEDDWLDKIPGKHRTILDAVSAVGVGGALHFASNILETSKSGYSLDSAEVAVVICLRHGA